MIKKYFIICVFLISLLTYSNTNTGKITIYIENLENFNGSIVVLFYNQDDGYPTKLDKAFLQFSFKISNLTKYQDSYIIEIPDIAYGEYAISLFHDANSNNKIDTNWIGIPKEGLGGSNNPKSRFGPPKYKDAKFIHNQENTVLNIKINYI